RRACLIFPLPSSSRDVFDIFAILAKSSLVLNFPPSSGDRGSTTAISNRESGIYQRHERPRSPVLSFLPFVDRVLQTIRFICGARRFLFGPRNPKTSEIQSRLGIKSFCHGSLR